LPHAFLPAAAFAEKDGTFTNSERRVQRVRRAIDPPGQARADWWITCELAKRIGRRLGCPTSGFDFTHPSEIFDEMARLWPAIGGLSYERLESGGIPWASPTPHHPGTRVLYGHKFPTGKARVAAGGPGGGAGGAARRRTTLIRTIRSSSTRAAFSITGTAAR